MNEGDQVELALSRGRLRPWRWDDVQSLVRHANNRDVSRNLQDRFPFPYTEEAAGEWLERHVGRSPITNFAIEMDGEAVGSVVLRVQSDVYRRTAELGYWLAEPYWGRGIMTEVVK